MQVRPAHRALCIRRLPELLDPQVHVHHYPALHALLTLSAGAGGPASHQQASLGIYTLVVVGSVPISGKMALA